jgi:pimeloyl-ACP methyl ester carboxylesterase
MILMGMSMMRGRRRIGLLARLAVCAAVFVSAPLSAQSALTTIDRYVPHRSTVPANAGRQVGLFLREKYAETLASDIASGGSLDGRVVLFVHGLSVPSVPDFDLPYRDYSWMAYLADAGFDTFAMDQTGYGHSPHPAMDDPCNVDAEDQDVLIPNPLPSRCAPSYRRQLTSSQTDWDEIDSVVDYIRELRGVDEVSLIGWSLGGERAGGYAARHPDKVDKLVLYAPVYQPASPSKPPRDFPREGAPMTLQTRDALMNRRWESGVACDDQVDPQIRDVVWQTIMAYDSLGAVWGPGGGVMRVRTAAYWGWDSDIAARLSVPTLIMVGKQDGLLDAGRSLYQDIGRTQNKVLVEMDCATHFAVWEASQHRFMQEASRVWLESGEFRGKRMGRVSVGYGGRIR